MKYLVLIWSLISLLQGCDALQSNSDFTPMVPDDTPFIVSALEATNDTIQHYPEVYVGMVSDPEGFEAEPVWTTPGIWWPVNNILVTRPVTRNDLKRTADPDAKVKIKGPLGTPEEAIVQFSNEGEGVYGDIRYELPLREGEKYMLSVKMGDGRQYTATTQIPEQFEWKVPDKVTMELKLGLYTDGVYNEKDIQAAEFPFSVGRDVGYIVYKANSEYDYFSYKVPKGGFMFDNRGDFLRDGATYTLFDVSSFPDKRLSELGWGWVGNEPLRSSEHWWISLSQLNISLSNFYYLVYRFAGSEPDGRFYRQDQERLKARVEHDTTYLFSISNIFKVGENGNVLPKEKTDAIGVFGGYSAAYRKLTVVPQRSWDPDTLNWGNQ